VNGTAEHHLRSGRGAACIRNSSIAVASADDVARARERFLSSEEDESLIPSPDPASWQRSQENDIDVDRINVPSYTIGHHDAPAAQCHADPRHAASAAAGRAGQHHPDRQHRHRARSPDDQPDLTGRLDAVSLSPGYSYAEEFAGTNGIWHRHQQRSGCASSTGASTTPASLGQFACAGAPIHHPTRHTVVGILDLTSWAHAPGAMLMALASATARQIEEELLAQTDLREFALFQEYLKACQQSGGAVLAINHDVVMMNEQVRTLSTRSSSRPCWATPPTWSAPTSAR